MRLRREIATGGRAEDVLLLDAWMTTPIEAKGAVESADSPMMEVTRYSTRVIAIYMVTCRFMAPASSANPVISWSFAPGDEDAVVLHNFTVETGSYETICGFVGNFDGILSGLGEPQTPSYEHTFVIDELLVVDGDWFNGWMGGLDVYAKWATYFGGRFRLLKDDTPDGDLVTAQLAHDVSSFLDGTLLLEGIVHLAYEYRFIQPGGD